MIQQDQLKQISSYTSHLLRQKFGRGPRICYAQCGHHFLVLHVRGFLSPLEEALLLRERMEVVQQARAVVIESILADLSQNIKETIAAEVMHFFHDWNYSTNTGVIIAVVREAFPVEAEGTAELFPVRMQLQEELQQLSKRLKIVPEQLEAFQINAKLYIVVRYGLLNGIEKKLLAQGYKHALRGARAELEKSYFQQKNRLEHLLQAEIEEMFIDWNLQEDHSLMCIFLK